MKRISKLIVCVAMIGLFGCASVPPATVQTDLQNAAQVVGGLAKDFLTLAGPEGTAITLAINTLCALRTSADAANPTAFNSDVQALLKELWTSFDSLNSAQANDIVLAINTLESLLSTAVANAGATTSNALPYIEAVTNGICQGFTGS